MSDNFFHRHILLNLQRLPSPHNPERLVNVFVLFRWWFEGNIRKNQNLVIRPSAERT